MNEDNMEQTQLTNNTLAMMALANEFCSAVEHCQEADDKASFIDNMLRLLPRIYITAFAIPAEAGMEMYINEVLDEDYYDSVRRSVEVVMGEDDSYLDVFEEDMKYSDTPIGASIAEGVADLFQVMYNYIETVRDAPNDIIVDVTASLREDFDSYWSRTLCNCMRALNAVRSN